MNIKIILTTILKIVNNIGSYIFLHDLFDELQ